MGFFDRFKGILGEDEGPKRADPQKEINRLMRELRRHVSEGKARFAGAVRDAQKLRRECLRLKAEVDREVATAKRCLAAGRENDARRALGRKVRAQGLLTEMTDEYSRQMQAIARLKESLEELAARLKTCETRRTRLRTQARRTKALAARQRLKDRGTEEDATLLLDELSARLEVEEELLAAGSAGDSLERRFAELEMSGEHQLPAELRAQLEDKSG